MPVKTNFNKKVLNNLDKFLSENHVVKIGIIGTKAERHENIDTVALAAVHEFGSLTRSIPPRPFLRPTMTSKESEFRADLYQNRDMILQMIANGQSEEFLNQSGIKWVNWIDEVFELEGPNWTPWSDRNRIMAGRKKRGHNTEKILFESGKLRRSISYEVT